MALVADVVRRTARGDTVSMELLPNAVRLPPS